MLWALSSSWKANQDNPGFGLGDKVPVAVTGIESIRKSFDECHIGKESEMRFSLSIAGVKHAALTLAVSVAVLGVIPVKLALATTITFSSLPEYGGLPNAVPTPGAKTYSEGGFTITSSKTGSTDGPNGLYYFDKSSVNSTGSIALLEFITGATDTITANDGGVFTLFSIDLATIWQYYSTQGNYSRTDYDVLFTGTHLDGSTVTQSFRMYNTLQPQTFSFTNFINLKSVAFDQGAYATGYQFDNVVLDASPTTGTVPEPASLALLGLGLAGLGFSRRKKA